MEENVFTYSGLLDKNQRNDQNYLTHQNEQIKYRYFKENYL